MQRIMRPGQHCGTDVLQVFLNADGAMYAFKGMAGRLAPIGVHASMLGILAGVAWGGAAGYKGSIMAPQGGEFLTASALRAASPLAQPPPGVLLHYLLLTSRDSPCSLTSGPA